ncbi:epoxide hydrolase [Saccharibacillus sp. CPCC 101409]|uniref:epoxide hydrolase family protein n=1 Tax=Saccharibacillus sp. CPCC 101409 TaxID=3058041 RepID=UPI00267262F0|nr:epoxide hydrolase family protein [Saccharibacillus sp. CPCC 101409]MDO3409803.1 epoxide hydrolase [Saccharibacillus sp. CPCC 101409]
MQPFTIEIPRQQIDDLRNRLQRIQWPSGFDAEPWSLGADAAFMRRLVDYWTNEYDWRKQERWLNGFPQFKANIGGLDIHFVHIRGEGKSPKPLIVTHGWPGSFIEHLKLSSYLARPSQYGGDPEDSFDIVIPSLPGYGFSQIPDKPGMGPKAVAPLWAELMTLLGYETFYAQGGDVGSSVSTWLAALYPERVKALHLNYILGNLRPSSGEGERPLSADEQDYLDRMQDWARREGAYASLHATKPDTPAFALSDSPVGLAAWITEKFRAWSDCGGDLENAVSLDELLTNISIYWFTNTVASSMRMYAESARVPLRFGPGEGVAVPTGVTLFPGEIPMPPREWAERVYNIVYWEHAPRGGHFASLEQPALLAEQIRAFVGSVLREE